MEKLANLLRPKSLDEIIGQEEIIGEDKIINNLVKNKHLTSMILYGRPGIGKTSIANAIVCSLDEPYKFLNATVNNKKDFDIAIEEAKLNNGMILIIDEIHRMNKDKQDLLLPYLENGLITLIGLTASNPYHSINPAIRSRVQIFKLKELTNEDIIKGLARANQYLTDLTVTKDALDLIANYSGGDFRSAINILETAYYGIGNNITVESLKKLNMKKNFFHDKNEDGYYDTLSALQKSIRGSDVNASLHYLARLIEAEDLDSIYRRLSVIVYEDIGLANPSLGPKLHAAIEACERVGLPEARIPLGTIVTEMALSPKSNSAHLALDEALNDINKYPVLEIPEHIKNGSPNYKYPHNYKNSYVKQTYLPKNLENKIYYHPKNNIYENNLNKIDKERKEL